MVNVTVSIDKDVYYTREFYELRRNRKLSDILNGFLRQHIGIQATELDLELSKANEEKERLEARLAALRLKKEEEIAAKAEEANKWRVVF